MKCYYHFYKQTNLLQIAFFLIKLLILQYSSAIIVTWSLHRGGIVLMSQALERWNEPNFASFECRARACQNNHRACFEPELSTNKNDKFRVRAYFEPFGKLGSPSLEPGAYLLRAKISARASKPEPRLVPPLKLKSREQSIERLAYE